MRHAPGPRLITVCATCLTACCKDGVFRCSGFMEAGVKQMPIDELERLGLEAPEYWEEEEKS